MTDTVGGRARFVDEDVIARLAKQRAVSLLLFLRINADRVTKRIFARETVIIRAERACAE